MKILTCIGCPRGCEIHIEEKDGETVISGYSCKNGRAFAETELRAPVRNVCSTVRTAFGKVPVLPVHLSADVPKERVFDVMREINSVTVSEPVGRGAVIIPDILGLGADLVSSSDILEKEYGHIKEGSV